MPADSATNLNIKMIAEYQWIRKIFCCWITCIKVTIIHVRCLELDYKKSVWEKCNQIRCTFYSNYGNLIYPKKEMQELPLKYIKRQLKYFSNPTPISVTLENFTIPAQVKNHLNSCVLNVKIKFVAKNVIYIIYKISYLIYCMYRVILQG